MEQSSAQQRAKWVERWKDSGLTANEFAAEAGLTATALYNWSSQLSAAARKVADHEADNAELPKRFEGRRRAKPERRSARPTPHFVELPVAAVTQASLMLELLLGDVRVRVPSGFDEETLARVVRALGVGR